MDRGTKTVIKSEGFCLFLLLFFLFLPFFPSFLPSFLPSRVVYQLTISQSIAARVYRTVCKIRYSTVQSMWGWRKEGNKRKERKKEQTTLSQKKKRKTRKIASPPPPPSNAGTSFGSVSYLITCHSLHSDWREAKKERRKGRTELTTAAARPFIYPTGAYPRVRELSKQVSETNKERRHPAPAIQMFGSGENIGEERRRPVGILVTESEVIYFYLFHCYF